MYFCVSVGGSGSPMPGRRFVAGNQAGSSDLLLSQILAQAQELLQKAGKTRILHIY